jgi:hypothetical protein
LGAGRLFVEKLGSRLPLFDWFNHIPELIKGALIAVFGFVLVFLWELYKRRSERREHEFMALREIKRGLSEALSIIESNRRILNNGEKADSVNEIPLMPLSLDTTWTTFARDLPELVRKDSHLWSGLTDCVMQSQFMNQYAAGREIFRNTQKGLEGDGYANGISGYRAALLNLYTEIAPILFRNLARLYPESWRPWWRTPTSEPPPEPRSRELEEITRAPQVLAPSRDPRE